LAEKMVIVEVFPKSLFGRYPYAKEKKAIATAFKNLVDAMVVLDTDFMRGRVTLLTEFWENVLRKLVPPEKAIEISKERVRVAYSKLAEITG